MKTLKTSPLLQNRQSSPYKLFSLIFLSAAMTMTTTACQKKSESVADKSVDANGNCTYAYVAHYNQVITDTEALDTAYNQTPPQETALVKAVGDLQSSCMTMATDHKNINCSAKTADGKEIASVRYEELRPNCSGVMAKIKANQGKPTSAKPFDGTEAKKKYSSVFELDYLAE